MFDNFIFASIHQNCVTSKLQKILSIDILLSTSIQDFSGGYSICLPRGPCAYITQVRCLIIIINFTDFSFFAEPQRSADSISVIRDGKRCGLWDGLPCRNELYTSGML